MTGVDDIAPLDEGAVEGVCRGTDSGLASSSDGQGEEEEESWGVHVQDGKWSMRKKERLRRRVGLGGR